MITHYDSNYEIEFTETPESGDTEGFNRNRFLRNLFYTMKKAGKKVGELEAEAGVSAGYIARLGKGTAIPSVEVVLKIADALNVSVDTILKNDILQFTEQEDYLIKFLNRLNVQTLNRKLEWYLQTVETLRYVDVDDNGNITHPLFTKFIIEEIDEVTGYPNNYERVGFLSNAFERDTGFEDDAFKVALDEDVDLYLMNVAYCAPIQGSPNPPIVEVWLHDHSKAPYFLCSTQNPVLKEIIDDLYKNVKEYSKFPSLKADTINIIDKFMNDSNHDK